MQFSQATKLLTTQSLSYTIFPPHAISFFTDFMYIFKIQTNTIHMIRKFIECGTIGWCLEIIFTATSNMKGSDRRLKGNTSLWMFPIYGMAVFLKPISRLLKGKSFLLRGSVYTFCIFLTEFITGKFLKKNNLCPWNYEHSPYNIDGVIRLDYAPYWFGAGLLYEYILNRNS